MGWQFKRAENTLSDLLGMKGQREMLRIYVAGMFVLGANSTFQQTYNSLGEGGKAFFFAFYRKIIMLIPLIYVLPTLLPWGVMAVVLVEPAAECFGPCIRPHRDAFYGTFRRSQCTLCPVCRSRKRWGSK